MHHKSFLQKYYKKTSFILFPEKTKITQGYSLKKLKRMIKIKHTEIKKHWDSKIKKSSSKKIPFIFQRRVSRQK
jgi:hypothetical protein